MKIDLTGKQQQALLDFARESEDAERLAEGYYTLDVYELEPPLTMEFELCEGGIDVLSAFDLLYSAPDDGWYLGDRIEEAGALSARLLGWQLLS